MKKPLAVLVGASPLGSERSELAELIKKNDIYKIAVDGGIYFFQKIGIRPDFWIGDMDSYKKNVFFINDQEINVEKEIESIRNETKEGTRDKAEIENRDDIQIKNECNVENDKDNGDDHRDFFKGIETKHLPRIKDDTDMAAAVEHAFANGCNEVIIYGGTGGERMAHTFANVQLMLCYAKMQKKITMVSDKNRMLVLYNDRLELPARENGYISIFALTDAAQDVEIKGLFYEYKGMLTNDVALGVSNEFCGKPAEISVKIGALLIIYEND